VSDEEIDDEIGPKERAYDEKIAPLVTEILALCKEHGIALTATFFLDGETTCSTHYEGDHETPPAMLRMGYYLIQARNNFDAFVIAMSRDGRKYGHSSMVLKMLERAGSGDE
jgi:hypothetical protein